eukprot:719889-Pelagomonas_calceolata.AAC.1
MIASLTGVGLQPETLADRRARKKYIYCNNTVFQPEEKKRKNYIGRGNSPSTKEEETHWLRRAVSLLHHKATKKKELIGIWRVTGSTRLQNLAVRSITTFHSTSSGNKLVGIQGLQGKKASVKTFDC